MFDRDLYPPYAFGLGYVIRQNITSSLLQAAQKTPLLHIEDVYVTGLLAEKLHYEPTFSNLFTIFPTNDVCSHRGMIAINRLDKFQEIPNLVKSVLDPKVKCKSVNELDFLKTHGLWNYILTKLS